MSKTIAAGSHQQRRYVAALRRDPCAYCAELPIETWMNLAAACAVCNQAKGNQRLLWFLVTCAPLAIAHAPEQSRGERVVGTLPTTTHNRLIRVYFQLTQSLRLWTRLRNAMIGALLETRS